jgi:phage tail-like protein
MGWDADDIIFGGKFKFDLQGAAEPITSASGGGVTFEKKEATVGTRADNLRDYTVTKVNWENFTIEKNYRKGKKEWKDWWDKTKAGDIEFKNFTLTYLDREGNDSGRTIKGFNAFPCRYDVINLDARSGSAAVRETMEMIVERYEYA